MYLLVSTPLQLLLLDAESGQSTTVRSGDGYYFGITSKDTTIALTHSLGYLQFFKEQSKPTKTIEHLHEPHQAEWIEDKILVANTGRNCVTVFNSQGEWVQDIFFNEVKRDIKNGEKLGNHFNSVHKVGDRVYVLAHNNNRPSELWELTWPDLKIIGSQISNAAWAHNLWSSDQGLVICDSKAGSLYEVTSGKAIWQSDQEGLITRGLAVNKEMIFIGYSQHSERKERYWNNGGVWIVDRQSLRTLDKISLPGAGQVYDIRLVGVLDECHNRQIITLEMLKRIQKINPLIELAYKARQQFPHLQRDVPFISQLLRARQIITGWKRKYQFEKGLNSA